MRLVLLPGMHGTETLFEPFLRALPPSLRPYVVTFPPGRPLGYDDLLPIVESALPDGEPFLLLGESFSGPLALKVAAKNPPGLRGVILVASFIRSPWRAPGWTRVFVRALFFRLVPKSTFLRSAFSRSRGGSLASLALAALAPVRADVLALRAREVFDLDAVEALRACSVPILYLVGGRDRIVSRRSLDEIRSIRPDVRVETFDAPHLVLQTRPAEAAQAITDFAAAMDRRATGS